MRRTGIRCHGSTADGESKVTLPGPEKPSPRPSEPTISSNVRGVSTSSQTSGGAPSSGLGITFRVTSGGLATSSGARMSRGRSTPVQMRLPRRALGVGAR